MIRRLLGIASGALVLATCRSADVATPKSSAIAPERKMYPVVQVRDSDAEPSEPPNVAAAEAEERMLLEQITAHLPPAAQSRFLEMLHKPSSVIGPNGTASISFIAATANEQLSDLISRYYVARRRTIRERQRQATLDVTNGRGINVILVLGTPTKGSAATAFPSFSTDPVDVVVLGPEATAGILSQALIQTERLRAEDGYRGGGFQIELGGPDFPIPDAARRQEMERLLEQLRAAPMRTIDRVGTVRAIDYRTRPLQQPPTP